jgi:hypothetical protein
VKHLVQRTIPTGRNQQIHFACFRYKPRRVALFRSHSHIEAISGCSLPRNGGPERVVASHFAVEN